MSDYKGLWIIKDYRGAFYSTVGNRWGLCSLDINMVRTEFIKLGWTPQVVAYEDIDFRNMDFRNHVILYQSTEDVGLKYKEYQEDILLGILLQGGVLVPRFRYFRAHHNKVFWEILRNISRYKSLITPSSDHFGTLEEFARANIKFPAVIKPSEGAGSKGVSLAISRNSALKTASRISRSERFTDIAKERFKRLTRKRLGYVSSSLHRNKFIAQDFVEKLEGDYKVLVYWDKYYLLRRTNRPADFRASGSGRYDWPKEPQSAVLDFARRLFDYFDVPLMSADIALGRNKPVLLEAQFVAFGPLTMEKSEWHFECQSGEWHRVDGQSVPEIEFARSISNFLINSEPQSSL